jgi:putative membrane protein
VESSEFIPNSAKPKDSPVLSSLALAGMFHPVAHGFGFLFFLIPLFWIVVLLLIVGLVGRRWRRRAMASGVGPWGRMGHDGWGHGGPGFWAGQQASRAAEVTLAERFAQGDIDEKEYRARLEVLRANVQQPPMGPDAQ